MSSILPIIPISDLQRSAKETLSQVKDFAVIQSHGRDRAFVLHPTLGKILLESGMLEELRKRWKAQASDVQSDETTEKELQGLIGTVLRELSKR